ncbi:MAG: FHA domain-containing protein [Bdellovibrionales bacterium]|nr:FHA domain-containing protein [Bdellovibrionales bacterium]
MSNTVADKKNKPAVKAKLRVLSGPFKGKSFKLVSEHIYLGRAAEVNDIVIDYDPYCSRKHALISKDPHSPYYTVSRIAHSANLYVGKKSVKDKLRLKNGSILTVGQTQFKLEILKKAELAIVPQQKNQLSNIRPPASSPADKNKSPNLLRLIIIITIIGLGLLLLTDSPEQSEQQKEKTKLRLEQDIEDDMQSINQRKEKVIEEKKESGSTAFKNAQQAYLKGIRDFRKGFFGRAKENFRVCKTLYPQHKLCGGYLKKAQVKYEQLAQRHLVLGKQYREKKQYRQCVSSFTTVMTMMSYDNNHPLFKEAKTNMSLCKLALKDSY